MMQLKFVSALTRAKKLVVVLGPRSAIQRAVSSNIGDERLASLEPRLRAAAARLSLAAQVFISLI